ncbi:hydroxyisourate hydrolase [Paenibacillus pectinilyticus]|uniref:5-hydroxyisourate hydrolase n=1 Tax=Paenibacillus pectinilyticus TaxID=512399 RepID=A0A1C1A883_9BACL|nr:hydroxyisourate hydrolase [Paenibacillus pectinilyticus]OCT16805.1 hydroxyisourate hydrolase [Paenibacillus pectinilyticus]
MSVGITSHVLDVSRGQPAVGVRIDLFRLEGGIAELLRTDFTNTDGRLPGPMLSGEDFTGGTYELLFHVGDYFREKGVELPEPAFLDQVPIRFGVANSEMHYHVPLLIAPWGYNTYRGS